MVLLLAPQHSPPKLVLVCVRSATSNIDAFCDSTIFDTDSIVCIGLYNSERTFSGTVKLPVNVIVGYQYFITNLIVMVDSQPILSCIVSVNVSLFPKSDCFPISNKFDIQKHIPAKNQLARCCL